IRPAAANAFGPATQKAIAQAVASSLLLSVHPFLSLVPLDELFAEDEPAEARFPEVQVRVCEDPDGSLFFGQGVDLEQPNPGPPPCPPAQPRACPYMRQAQPCDRQVRLLGDQGLADSVLANLRDLELASCYLQFGRELARAGHTDEALECMEF